MGASLGAARQQATDLPTGVHDSVAPACMRIANLAGQPHPLGMTSTFGGPTPSQATCSTPKWKGERTHIEGKLNEVRPGRFIRSALAGMTALTPKLIDSHPDLVGAVRHGVAAPAPEGIRLLAAIAPDGAAAVLEGAHEGLAVKLSRDGGRDDEWTTTTTPTISAVIHFPPFSLLLADRQLVSALPHADCTDWLELGVDDLADVSLVLPVVDLPRTPDAPVPVSMLRFIEARA